MKKFYARSIKKANFITQIADAQLREQINCSKKITDVENENNRRIRKPEKTNLSGTVLVKVLLLGSGAKVESDIVNEIGGVLGKIQYHKIKVQPNNTASQHPKRKKKNGLRKRKMKIKEKRGE